MPDPTMTTTPERNIYPGLSRPAETPATATATARLAAGGPEGEGEPMPCPFCGGTAVFDVRAARHRTAVYDRIAVVCSACHARSRSFVDGPGGEDAAVAAWNRRAESRELAAARRVIDMLTRDDWDSWSAFWGWLDGWEAAMAFRREFPADPPSGGGDAPQGTSGDERAIP